MLTLPPPPLPLPSWFLLPTVKAYSSLPLVDVKATILVSESLLYAGCVCNHGLPSHQWAGVWPEVLLCGCNMNLSCKIFVRGYQPLGASCSRSSTTSTPSSSKHLEVSHKKLKISSPASSSRTGAWTVLDSWMTICNYSIKVAPLCLRSARGLEPGLPNVVLRLHHGNQTESKDSILSHSLWW